MKLKAASPMVPVADIPASVAFWTETLGFAAPYVDDVYAYLFRDGAVVRLVLAAPDTDVNDPTRQQSCYIDVEDIDALHESLAPALTALPDGHYRPLFTQTYGMREFHVIHGALLIYFGAPTPESGMP